MRENKVIRPSLLFITGERTEIKALPTDCILSMLPELTDPDIEEWNVVYKGELIDPKLSFDKYNINDSSVLVCSKRVRRSSGIKDQVSYRGLLRRIEEESGLLLEESRIEDVAFSVLESSQELTLIIEEVMKAQEEEDEKLSTLIGSHDDSTKVSVAECISEEPLPILVEKSNLCLQSHSLGELRLGTLC